MRRENWRERKKRSRMRFALIQHVSQSGLFGVPYFFPRIIKAAAAGISLQRQNENKRPGLEPKEVSEPRAR